MPGTKNGQAVWVGICPTHQKRHYKSKREARRAIRQHPNPHGLSVFRCGEWWHIGHLPKGVVNGSWSRAVLRTAVHHPSCPARDGSGSCVGCGR